MRPVNCARSSAKRASCRSYPDWIEAYMAQPTITSSTTRPAMMSLLRDVCINAVL
jgi:hypothetical protein